MTGWGRGNLPRLLGNFAPLFLFDGLFGRQGVLLLRLGFLQLGLIKAGDFPHVRLVCHFPTTRRVSFRARPSVEGVMVHAWGGAAGSCVPWAEKSPF